jgi:hypothetical protein
MKSESLMKPGNLAMGILQDQLWNRLLLMKRGRENQKRSFFRYVVTRGIENGTYKKGLFSKKDYAEKGRAGESYPT